MAGERFDAWSKSLATAGSRRAFLKGLGAGVVALVGGAGLRTTAEPAEADCTSHCNGTSNTACTSFCIGTNNPKCEHDCTGANNPACQYYCSGPNNPHCQHDCVGSNNPACISDCTGTNNPKCRHECSGVNQPACTANCSTGPNAPVLSIQEEQALAAPCSAAAQSTCETAVAQQFAPLLVQACTAVCAGATGTNVPPLCLQCVAPYADATLYALVTCVEKACPGSSSAEAVVTPSSATPFAFMDRVRPLVAATPAATPTCSASQNGACLRTAEQHYQVAVALCAVLGARADSCMDQAMNAYTTTVSLCGREFDCQNIACFRCVNDTCQSTCGAGNTCTTQAGCCPSNQVCGAGCCTPGTCCFNGACVSSCPDCFACNSSGQCVLCADANLCCAGDRCVAPANCPGGSTCISGECVCPVAGSTLQNGQCICTSTGQPPVNGSCGTTSGACNHNCPSGSCWDPVTNSCVSSASQCFNGLGGTCCGGCCCAGTCTNGTCTCPPGLYMCTSVGGAPQYCFSAPGSCCPCPACGPPAPGAFFCAAGSQKCPPAGQFGCI